MKKIPLSQKEIDGGMDTLLAKAFGKKVEEKTCVICGEKAEGSCGHCGNDYCEKHYMATVRTGNCCRANEEDYN